jgi:hypothetical protein
LNSGAVLIVDIGANDEKRLIEFQVVTDLSFPTRPATTPSDALEDRSGLGNKLQFYVQLAAQKRWRMPRAEDINACSLPFLTRWRAITVLTHGGSLHSVATRVS